MFSFKEVIIFGTGGLLNIAVNELTKMHISVKFLCDNNPTLQHTRIENRLVLKPEELKSKNMPVVITSMYANDIAKQLETLGIEAFYDFSYAFDYQRWHRHLDPQLIKNNEKKINQVLTILNDQQSKDVFLSLINYRKTSNPVYIQPAQYVDYFHPIVHPQHGDCIIDGGAWYGDSSLDFSHKLKGECQIYAFEPDSENFSQLNYTIEKEKLSSSVVPVNLGIFNEKKSLFFKKETKNDMQFQVQSEETPHKIDVTSIDRFAKERNIEAINFIKMDIEGSEIMALKGAKETIKNHQPKLAICIYHEFNDLWEIPLLVKKLNPKYKLYLGHHSQNLFETVLYAI